MSQPLTVTPKQALEYRMDRNNTGRTAVKHICVFRVQGILKEGLRAFLFVARRSDTPR